MSCDRRFYPAHLLREPVEPEEIILRAADEMRRAAAVGRPLWHEEVQRLNRAEIALRRLIAEWQRE